MAVAVKIYILIFSFCLWANLSAEENKEPGVKIEEEIPQPDGVNAYRQFWYGFEQYEQKVLRDGKEKFLQSYEKLKSEYEKERQKIIEDQIDKLKEAAIKYKIHLQRFPKAENRAFVMLNLAQIQNMLADALKEKNASGQGNKAEALSLLKDLETHHKNFVYREEALYLRANILKSLGQNDEALAVWENLASIAKNSLYGIYANVAVGDYYFDNAQPKEAIRHYQKGLLLLTENVSNYSVFERVRIQYRLAWAAYRAAELKLAIDTAVELLTPGRQILSNEQRQKIEQDSVDLIGDSLYENNDIELFQDTINKKELLHFAAAIGLRTIKRFSGDKIYNKVTKFGEFLVKQFPTAAELPEMLLLLSDAYQNQALPNRKRAALERLAILLPQDSLWRARHKDNFELIQNMEVKAKAAAEEAAESFYQQGILSGNGNSFMAAAALYQILVDFLPQGDLSNSFRLRYANCNFLANRVDEAAKLYADLKQNYKLNTTTLEITAYQLVLAREKQWRKAFSTASEKGDNPAVDPVSIEHLRNLELAVDEFANRFPDRQRSVDLLLMAASANRDHERFPASSQYWERCLISSPTVAQRAIAIRGLVLAAMKAQNPGEVIDRTRRFLKLEDWRALGVSLGQELEGVLSAATFEQSKILSDAGQVQDAGILMVQIAQEFKNIPQREKIYRDGAYLLAIAGDWASAQDASLQYATENLRTYAGDMAYLNARANEYQIRFGDAAKAYLTFSKGNPQHTRSMTSLGRAQNLALAENDFLTAGKAAELEGDNAKSKADKLKAYELAVIYYNKANANGSALNAAEKRRVTATDRGEIYRSELMVARAQYANGDQEKALIAYENLARKAKSQRETLNERTFAEVYGEANFHLGNEAKQKFDDFDIFERKGSIGDNVKVKLDFFQDIVKKFDLAASANHPEWAPRARYELATAAETFADEITSIPVKMPNEITGRVRERYQETAERLKKVAKRYYSTNLLVKNKNPDLYVDNEWIKKSSVKLTGYGETDQVSERAHQLPSATHSEMPYQWSL